MNKVNSGIKIDIQYVVMFIKLVKVYVVVDWYIVVVCEYIKFGKIFISSNYVIIK